MHNARPQQPTTGSAAPQPDRRLSVAPMMGWTDRHERYFLRLISAHTLLYTEMITTGALLRGDGVRSLRFDPREHPVAAQIGGSEPGDMAACARMVEASGFDEVNVNVGCPSPRVSSGRFGACLLLEPDRVARCVDAMSRAVDIPVTVKTRIGVDNQDSYDALKRFIGRVASAGCRSFIVHARKAWLQGLSPKENREVPPLRYDVAERLKSDFPELEIVINGGITSLEQAGGLLRRFDGAMVGREAYHNPYMLAQADRLLFGATAPPPSRERVLAGFLDYAEGQMAQGVPLKSLTRHVHGLFAGLPGARSWRRALSENSHYAGASLTVVRDAARCVLEGSGETAGAGRRDPSADPRRREGAGACGGGLRG